jgi:ribosomal protein S18 acetylase RimI-like enzyme
MIRPAGPEHIATVARLHAEAIPHGFLTLLGAPFLTELYRSLASQPGTCVLVAVDANGSCFGFVAGTVHTRGLFRRVLYRHWYRFAASTWRHLLLFGRFKNLAETALYGLRPKREPGRAEVEAELLSMAVAGEHRGAGTGKALVLALEAFLAKRGVAAYKVVTTADDPRSNAFYRACRLELSCSFLHHGRPMNEYVKFL